MPWKETCIMDERIGFIGMYLSQEWSLASLCRYYGITRRTGYKWLIRYFEDGPKGLDDHSRAPHYHPQAISAGIEEAVLAARNKHRSWGARKLRIWLERQDSGAVYPAASTIGDILRRHGLTVPRHRSRKTPPFAQPFHNCDHANAVWSADLKGWFNTGDGTRCDPLTITDNYSRYLLRCQAVAPATFETIQPVFEAAFREYGLPEAIRTDNGPPFATTTVGGLSRLSIWWIKLGIQPERIDPGKPAQNGRHERMHRTLKRETATPPKLTWRQQQKAFDIFRDEYNRERPHEGLGLQTPASFYISSPRSYPLLVPEMTYPDDMALRWVKSQGDISWKSRHVYLSETLAGEVVGLKQVDDHLWDIFFASILLAKLDSRSLCLIHLPKNKKSKEYELNKHHENMKKLYTMSPV